MCTISYNYHRSLTYLQKITVDVLFTVFIKDKGGNLLQQEQKINHFSDNSLHNNL